MVRKKLLEGVFYLVAFVVLIFCFNRVSAVSANDSLNNVYQCGTLDSAGTYTMNQSITPSGSIASCINVTNQNITLNCAGFWISNITLAKTGIYSNQINTTIKNCNVTMKSTSGGQAVTLTGANYSYIFNSTFSGYQIIVLAGANNNILEKLTVNGDLSTSHDGVISSNSNNNQFLNITSTGNNYGISLSGSNNTLKYNNLTGNTYNFQFDATSNSNIDNFVDTSNLVGEYYIYYNYSISNYEFNLNSAPNAGLVYCLNCTNITIKDLNLSHSNEKGIYFFNTTSSTIQNVTSNNNRFGIVFLTSSNNQLINVTSSDNRRGIDFKTSSNSNTLKQIIVERNYDYGIYLETDSSNNNLSVITTSLNDYGVGLSSSNGNNLSGINSTGDTSAGVSLSAANDNFLFDINPSSSKYGISLTNSKNNTINRATVSNNHWGIYIATNSHNSNLSNIVSNKNGYGFFFSSSQNITLTEITASSNMKAVNSSTSGFTSEGSNLNHNLVTNIINTSLIEETIDRTYVQNSNISLSFYISYINGTATSNYNYNISVYPTSSYSAVNNSNNITVTFNTTKEGVYTLSVNVTLLDTNDTEVRNFVFLLGNSSSKTATYYMHSNKPSHGQSRNTATSTDSGSAFSYSTTEEEQLNALSFIQYSPEQIMNQYFLIKNISLGWFYKGTGTPLSKIQRYALFSTTADYSQSLSVSSSYIFNTTNFTDLNITSDYSWRIYWLAFKLSASSPYALSNLTQQSYADFTYIYSGPQITQFTENSGSDIRNARILSSTFDDSENKDSTIQLDGEGNFTIVLNLTSANYIVIYDGISCPSENCTINSNSGGTVNVTFSLGSMHTLRVYENTTVAETVAATTDSSSGTLPNYKISTANLENGYEQNLREGFKISFSGGDGRIENHTLTVKEVSGGDVTIIVSSEPITFVLKINETKKLDLDKNGIYDLEVSLKEIKGYFAKVFLKSLNEKIIGGENVETDEETPKNATEDSTEREDKKEINLFVIFVSAVVLIILVICLILVLRHRRRKSRRYGHRFN